MQLRTSILWEACWQPRSSDPEKLKVTRCLVWSPWTWKPLPWTSQARRIQCRPEHLQMRRSVGMRCWPARLLLGRSSSCPGPAAKSKLACGRSCPGIGLRWRSTGPRPWISLWHMRQQTTAALQTPVCRLPARTAFLQLQDIIRMIERMMVKKTLPHMRSRLVFCRAMWHRQVDRFARLLHGPPGTGKTSTIMALAKTMCLLSGMQATWYAARNACKVLADQVQSALQVHDAGAERV